MGNSKNQEGFGGKRMERHGGNKIALSTKNNTGICSGCQKKGEALFKPSTEKERYCINCFTKKIKDKK